MILLGIDRYLDKITDRVAHWQPPAPCL